MFPKNVSLILLNIEQLNPLTRSSLFYFIFAGARYESAVLYLVIVGMLEHIHVV